MKRLLLTVFLIVFTATAADAATSVTQHGITWTFADDETVGQFVNGDYYVVGSVDIIDISPGYTTSPRAMNGSMINPSSLPQGYDYGPASGTVYSAALNVGIGITPSTPLTLTAGQSLVSTIGNDPPQVKNEYINTAAVLTCLSTAPPAGTFRPGISGTTKTLHNFSSLNLNLLHNLAVPSGQTITASTLNTYAAYLRMPWLSHYPDYYVEEIHPSASGLDEYYYSITFSEIALLLHLNFTNEEKEQLLINFIQLGIDLFSYIESGGPGWYPNGGHGNGRKWPILFAGIMLDYAPMKNIGQKSGDYLYAVDGKGPGNPPTDYIHFTEDGQTFYVADEDLAWTSTTAGWVSDVWRVSGIYLAYDAETYTFTIGDPEGATIGPWNPDTRNQDEFGAVRCRPYTSAMLGMPEWGIRHSRYPIYSDSSWLANYRTIGSGPPTWPGTTLAARIMGVKALWNNNALFDYVDRYMAIANGLPDPFGFTVDHIQSGSAPTGLIDAMWDQYGASYRGRRYAVRVQE